MFAVLKTGGKQYRVKSGDMLRVEKLAADAGEKVQFNEVLMLGGDDLVVGAPLVDDAAVQAEVVDIVKGDKVINYVKRRRKHSSQRTRGHRQQLTLLRVTDILAKGAGKSGVKAAIRWPRATSISIRKWWLVCPGVSSTWIIPSATFADRVRSSSAITLRSASSGASSFSSLIRTRSPTPIRWYASSIEPA